MAKTTNTVTISNTQVPASSMPMQIGVTPALWLDAADSSTLQTQEVASYFMGQSGDRLEVASNSTLQTGNVDWWLSAWVNVFQTTNIYQGVVTKCNRSGTNGAKDFELSVNYSAGSFLSVGDGTNAQTISLLYVPYSEWAHYFAYKIGGTIYLYINNGDKGAVSANLTITPSATTEPLQIGGPSTIQFSNSLYGTVDAVTFGKPSTGWLASNVNALRSYFYNNGQGTRSTAFKGSSFYTGGNPSGAVSFWDLNESSGTRNDSIGTNNLTPYGSVGTNTSIIPGTASFDGDQITSWNDKSGNFRHATASSQSVRPTYKISSINNQGFVQYDGIDDVLTIPSSTATFAFLHQSPSTVFMVVSIGSSSDVNALVLLVNNSGSSSGLIGFAISYDDRASINRNNGINSFISTGVGGQTPVVAYSDNYFPTQTVGMLSLVYDPANATGASRHTMYLNGGNAKSTNSATATPVASNASNNLAIGGVNAQIRFYELIIYPSLLSTSQRQRIQRYLAEKWMSSPTVTLITSSSTQYLEWAAVDMASSYAVYYRVSGDTSWTLSTTTTSLSTRITGLTAGTSYDFRVDAVWSA